VIVSLLAEIANCDPRFKPTAEMAYTWSRVLRRFTDEQLQEGVDRLVMTEGYGPPTVGRLVQMIEGVERVVRVRVRDLYNHYRLNPDQSHVTEAVTVRWFPDGREEPVKLPPHRDASPLLGGGFGSIRDDLDGMLGEGLEA
jgi:hypothetical protein